MTATAQQLPEWELAQGCTYILTEDDVSPNGNNPFWQSASSYPLNVPLCGFCDEPVPSDGRCEGCCTIHEDVALTDFAVIVSPDGVAHLSERRAA